MGELDRCSGTEAIARNRRQLRGDERAERIDESILVVNVATVECVLFVDTIVDAQEIFTIVERVWLLERYVVADRTIRECSRKTDRRQKHIRNRTAVSCNSISGNDISQYDVGASEAPGSNGSRRNHTLRIDYRSNTGVRGVIWIAEHSVVRRACDAVKTTQTK